LPSGKPSQGANAPMPHGTWSWKPGNSKSEISMNSDFKDLLRALNAHGVEYLIVGGYAFIHYT